MVLGAIPGIPSTKSNPGVGFNDPEKMEDGTGRYPTVIHEPDTNRLARNDANNAHSVISAKNTSKTSNVTIALCGGEKPAANNWAEPNSPYAAVYPNNHVYETASGHIKEYDDTEKNERIHEYHRAGTFYEIDGGGNRTVKIVGDGYHVVAGSDHLFVGGNCNITVESNCNMYVKKDWNIQVDGDMNLLVQGNLSLIHI